MMYSEMNPCKTYYKSSRQKQYKYSIRESQNLQSASKRAIHGSSKGQQRYRHNQKQINSQKDFSEHLKGYQRNSDNQSISKENIRQHQLQSLNQQQDIKAIRKREEKLRSIDYNVVNVEGLGGRNDGSVSKTSKCKESKGHLKEKQNGCLLNPQPERKYLKVSEKSGTQKENAQGKDDKAARYKKIDIKASTNGKNGHFVINDYNLNDELKLLKTRKSQNQRNETTKVYEGYGGSHLHHLSNSKYEKSLSNFVSHKVYKTTKIIKNKGISDASKNQELDEKSKKHYSNICSRKSSLSFLQSVNESAYLAHATSNRSELLKATDLSKDKIVISKQINSKKLKQENEGTSRSKIYCSPSQNTFKKRVMTDSESEKKIIRKEPIKGIRSHKTNSNTIMVSEKKDRSKAENEENVYISVTPYRENYKQEFGEQSDIKFRRNNSNKSHISQSNASNKHKLLETDGIGSSLNLSSFDSRSVGKFRKVNLDEEFNSKKKQYLAYKCKRPSTQDHVFNESPRTQNNDKGKILMSQQEMPSFEEKGHSKEENDVGYSEMEKIQNGNDQIIQNESYLESQNDQEYSKDSQQQQKQSVFPNQLPQMLQRMKGVLNGYNKKQKEWCYEKSSYLKAISQLQARLAVYEQQQSPTQHTAKKVILPLRSSQSKYEKNCNRNAVAVSSDYKATNEKTRSVSQCIYKYKGTLKSDY